MSPLQYGKHSNCNDDSNNNCSNNHRHPLGSPSSSGTAIFPTNHHGLRYHHPSAAGVATVAAATTTPAAGRTASAAAADTTRGGTTTTFATRCSGSSSGSRIFRVSVIIAVVVVATIVAAGLLVVVRVVPQREWTEREREGRRQEPSSLGDSLGDLLRVQAPTALAQEEAASSSTSTRPNSSSATTTTTISGTTSSHDDNDDNGNNNKPDSEETTAAARASAARAAAAASTAAVLSKADQSALDLFRSAHEQQEQQSPDENNAVPPAVFYNFFMSPLGGKQLGNETAEDTALRIFREQIAQVGESLSTMAIMAAAAARKKTNETPTPSVTITIYYNTIGRRNGLNASYVREHCDNAAQRRNRLKCVRMRHYDRGFEQLTLQRLYEYCHLYPTRRVVYMHSKGSYHPSPTNEMLRKYMTAAVVHEDCLLLRLGNNNKAAASNSKEEEEQQCNVCGLLFQPVWMPMFPGNFWTAKCSYIRKLLPPAEFNKASKVALRDAIPSRPQPPQNQNNDNNEKKQFLTIIPFTFRMYSQLDELTLGLDRFAMEAWVGSHPDLVPCHVSRTQRFKFWFKDHGDPMNSTTARKLFSWQMAPEPAAFAAADDAVDAAPSGGGGDNNKTTTTTGTMMIRNANYYMMKRFDLIHKVLPDDAVRFREFFLLPGKLHKWIKLYDTIPNSRSWYWKYFPDGIEWQRAIRKYGKRRAVETIVSAAEASQQQNSRLVLEEVLASVKE